jgi:ketosteroid isomerase-like protein
MSQENVELTCKAVDAFNRRDLDAFLALAHLEVEHVALVGEVYSGHDGLRSWWEDIVGRGEDTVAEIQGVRDFGDVVQITVCLRGHGISSGLPFAQTVWMVIKWREGKSFKWSSHLREADALEAVGLCE